MPHLKHEKAHGLLPGLSGGRIVCGIDEVGRGPLAGPVVACAVVIDPARLPRGLAKKIDDSKKLAPAVRQSLHDTLLDCVSYGIGQASVDEIDEINILQASFLAMQRAVEALPTKPDIALVDGNRPPRLGCETHCLIGGDAISLTIASASIIAKVVRDKIMYDLALEHTVYGWETNVGYATPEHLAGIKRHGVCAHHRQTFRPISQSLSITD
ncbi:ribonuclease HII [Dongia soli]|uniref:Ribonuclease HII n=1 Tax=Dongia soli TaxID=600628 RepID=A0ABU5ED18_9PROT|nr:ribonuclease HII [Dongia soli]MDY0883939.1 ribonuclease HII [Dongia soli]